MKNNATKLMASTAPSVSSGYNPEFLSFQLPLPTSKTPPDALLDYRHFTVAMNVQRRMCAFTAVNIDAVKYNQLKSQIPTRSEIGADNWIPDPRLDTSAQLLKSFYVNNKFDIGHMVRREDPLWGDTLEEALEANNDTFHVTNACPQHELFNRGNTMWKGLEDYALKNARKNDLRLSVFTGCVFDKNDRHFEDVQIPSKFWKVLVMVKENGEPSATGYIISQFDLIKDVTERELGFEYEQFQTYRVKINEIEKLTGLRFSLDAFEPKPKMSTRELSDDEPLPIINADDLTF